jgi:plastocyanin
LAVVVLFVGAIAIATNRAGSDDDPGMLFVIPAGASDLVAVPTIDSAIEIPTDIRFGPGDVARITVRNDDSVANRAGPWVIGPGQTYTARFDNPGVYEFECTVDSSESVRLTVTGEEG